MACWIASCGCDSEPRPASPASSSERTIGAGAGSITRARPFDASGFVRTADGSPVPGATLRLINTDTKQVWVSWTDASGKFEFPTVPPGHYTIEAVQLGFVSMSIEAQFSTPPPQPPPLQLSLRVATLAQLAAPAGSNQPERGRGQRPNGGPGAGQNATNGGPGGSGPPGGRGGQGGRRGGQLPQGLLNAVQQGLAGGGFQQTDVTGGSEAGDEGVGEANAPVPPAAGGSSDSFLLQGTVGQGLSYNAGGFPGGGFGGPGGPGGAGGPGGPGGESGEPGGAAGQMFGAGGGPGGGPGGGGPGGGFAGGRAARAIQIFNTGGGRGGPLGRLFRQQANRVRYSFYDRYENSAFDARPYAITGTPAAKIGHYDERVGGNIGGPLKIPHIYNGADHTYFFVNYQHETVKTRSTRSRPCRRRMGATDCLSGEREHADALSIRSPRLPYQRRLRDRMRSGQSQQMPIDNVAQRAASVDSSGRCPDMRSSKTICYRRRRHRIPTA